MSRFSSLIKSSSDKLMVLQRVVHCVRFLLMHFYVILKNSSSQNVPLIFLPKVFKRHADDIFVILLYQSHLNDFVYFMKMKHLDIKFTSRFEKNDCLIFRC